MKFWCSSYALCAALSYFNRVRLFVTLWTVAHQAPLSVFSREESRSGSPCPSPGGLPDPGFLHCRQILHRLSLQGSPFIAVISFVIYKDTGSHSELV